MLRGVMMTDKTWRRVSISVYDLNVILQIEIVMCKAKLELMQKKSIMIISLMLFTLGNTTR